MELRDTGVRAAQAYPLYVEETEPVQRHLHTFIAVTLQDFHEISGMIHTRCFGKESG